MNIEVCIDRFEPGSSAVDLYGSLIHWLLDRGHSVSVKTVCVSDAGDADGFPDLCRRERFSIVKVEGARVLQNIQGLRKLNRVVQRAKYFWSLLVSKCPDVRLVYSPPLILGLTAVVSGRVRGIPCVVNVQDLHPRVLLELGFINSRLYFLMLKRIEHYIYKNSSYLIVFSESNKEHLLRNCASAKRVEIVPNWVTVDTKILGSDRAVLCGSIKRSVPKIVYAGTMGRAQGLDAVVKGVVVARSSLHCEFDVLMVGDGPEVRSLMAASSDVSNIKFMERVTPTEYAALISTADVGIVSLNEKTPLETVPGKLQNLMALGIPVLLIANPNGDAAKIVEQAKAGVVAESGNPESIANAILQMVGNSAVTCSMGRKGYEYAMSNFSLPVCASRFERCMKNAISIGH